MYNPTYLLSLRCQLLFFAALIYFQKAVCVRVTHFLKAFGVKREVMRAKRVSPTLKLEFQRDPKFQCKVVIFSPNNIELQIINHMINEYVVLVLLMSPEMPLHISSLVKHFATFWTLMFIFPLVHSFLTYDSVSLSSI